MLHKLQHKVKLIDVLTGVTVGLSLIAVVLLELVSAQENHISHQPLCLQPLIELYGMIPQYHAIYMLMRTRNSWFDHGISNYDREDSLITSGGQFILFSSILFFSILFYSMQCYSILFPSTLCRALKQ